MLKTKTGLKGELQKLGYFFAVVPVFLIYFFSNSRPQNHFDYTFRIAESLLSGKVSVDKKDLSWLNELVPFDGFWYSVFPLGSVLTMIPAAFLKTLGLIKEMPGGLIAALTASLICLFLLLIARRYDLTENKQALLTLGILFGTWMWANLIFAGAWQLALGFAVLGELGAIYFTVFNRRSLLAGFFFALAFGNRTEILLTAPIFIFLLLREKTKTDNSDLSKNQEAENGTPESDSNFFSQTLSALTKNKLRVFSFCLAPFILGVSTLVYNYIRFHSAFDFGYARIPGVLDEPWYNHGIFSVYYIPRQAYEMLLKPWNFRVGFPYLQPDGFSSSILFSSPFLIFVLKTGSRDRILKWAAWAAIFVLTLLLWMHGNAGGWQFGYRYAMILLPWIFLILLESSSPKITRVEWFAYSISFLLNAYAVVFFHWMR